MFDWKGFRQYWSFVPVTSELCSHLLPVTELVFSIYSFELFLFWESRASPLSTFSFLIFKYIQEYIFKYIVYSGVLDGNSAAFKLQHKWAKKTAIGVSPTCYDLVLVHQKLSGSIRKYA